MEEFHTPPLGAPIYLSFMTAIVSLLGGAEERLGTDRWNSRAGLIVRDWILREGLCELLVVYAEEGHQTPTRKAYVPTDRGRAWVKHACDTPLPIMVGAAWVRP